MKILHLDNNHPILITGLNALGFTNDEAYTASREEIEGIIHNYDGIIIRSRLSLDKDFIAKATRLKFIGRVGTGLENIDCHYAQKRSVYIISASGANANAVGEHALGMLLSLFNKLNKADREVRQGKWMREANRGVELDGKTVAIIGYGNTGKSLARKLSGFNVEVLCHDIIAGLGDGYARQVPVEEIQQRADVLSLHVPQTSLTGNMVNKTFISGFAKPFWLINTARGQHVITAHLVKALKEGKILGAGLDVLEYEEKSFETVSASENLPEPFRYLINAENVLLSPHIAGWTFESREKLAQCILNKIKARFC